MQGQEEDPDLSLPQEEPQVSLQDLQMIFSPVPAARMNAAVDLDAFELDRRRFAALKAILEAEKVTQTPLMWQQGPEIQKSACMHCNIERCGRLQHM